MSAENLCPNCSTKLRVWYSLTRMECICQCPNDECVLTAIEGTGDTSNEAMEQFQGKSLLKGKARKSQ